MGHFKEGWKYYEYRWEVSPGNKVTWPFQEKPIWEGERGKRIALWKEQGIGDDIIFLGLVPEVKEMCSSLSVYVDPRLQSLCRRSMPEINFVKDIDELKDVESDYHLPLGSIPGLIRNDISDFDRTVTGYLKADPQRVDLIRNELKLNGKTVIGVSWKSFKSLTQIKKSIQLCDMGRIFVGLDVVLVNLQYGDVEDEIKEFKEETGIEVLQCASVDNREDLDGLAALIEACDMVVSTSNVTIHMAGALAKETWVLQPYVANFWWFLERTDSVWYPSLTLYRQPALDDWESVYGSIRKDLENRLQCN
jgi:ADP-heptose:LPS heptosyltransferase